jgi:hypothetical protein
MKKVFLAIVLLTTGVIASQAQIKYGLKAGANFYQFGGKDAEDAGVEESRKIKIGIAGGGFVNFKISDNFSVQPEVLYSSEGNLQKEGDTKFTYALNYINVPVLVQYNASGFYAETGPQVGFLMSAKAKFDDGTDEEEEDVKDSFKGINFSWAIGLGYRLENGLGFGARYNLGLASIIDSDDDIKITSSGFHIGLSYQFGGDK